MSVCNRDSDDASLMGQQVDEDSVRKSCLEQPTHFSEIAPCGPMGRGRARSHLRAECVTSGRCINISIRAALV